MTEKPLGQSNLYALPARRAYEAYWESITDGGEPPGQFDELDLDESTAWESAMQAAYPSMRDEYVRLSIERDDARSEHNQASASYQQAAAEREQAQDGFGQLARKLAEAVRSLEAVTGERNRLTAQLDAVRASRERLLNDLGWIYGYSDDPAVLDRVRQAVEAARTEDAEQLPATTPPDGPERHESGRTAPSAGDDTPEAAARLSGPREGATS